ncbi:MAG TPA: M14 family metallopeptidase [Bacillota bacterium]|nr:M14 family metallopeptidase [Bacillota bacterium]
MKKLISLSSNMDYSSRKKAINLALGLGFETINTEFPITQLTDSSNVDQLWEEWSKQGYTCISEPRGYTNSSQSAQEIPPYDWRKDKGLESLFTYGPLLPDRNLDLLPDAINLKIVLSPSAEIATVAAACNFAFRLGMETTAYQGSIVAEPGHKGNRLQFTGKPNFSIHYLLDDNDIVIEVDGRGEDLIESSSRFLEEFPHLNYGYDWSDFLMHLTDSLTLRNIDGQLAALNLLSKNKASNIRALTSEQDENGLEQIRNSFPAAKIDNYKEKILIYEKEYDIPWENDVFLQELEKNVIPRLQPDDRVEIYGCLSEDKESREKLTETVREKINTAGSADKVEIRNAFKQGISWIMDFVLPDLHELPVAKIKISFNSFLPPGEEIWTDESASTPKYNMSAEGGKDRWNDLPIRYLQELYPVDDLIEQELELDREKIEFELYEGDEDLSYLLQAFDAAGSEIYSSKYKASFSERQYLDRFPNLGKVHPSTGYLLAVVNGEFLYQTDIQTDVERIWDIYQTEILEDCLSFVESKYKDSISEEKQPFFSLLEVNIKASEPNEQLGVREDLLSSLDSLHEDIYFAGTDFFKQIGISLGAGVLDAPGLILPRIEKQYGKPSLKVKLYDQLAIEPSVASVEKSFGAKARDSVSAFISSISTLDKGWKVEVETTGVEPELLSSLAGLADNPLLSFKSLLPGVVELVLHDSDTNEYSLALNAAPAKIIEKTKNIRDIDLCESEVIGYEQYSRIISELEDVPGLAIYPIAESYMGLDLHAIEFIGNKRGYTSRVKRLTHLPSLYINTRHHANEVSGTNAAFMLVRELLTDPKYADLTEKLNLVSVPMENPDGASIHYDLQKVNPYWSFHVARFNAIGKEFYYNHFDPDTIHTEANGLRKLWYHSLPDIMIDNHGVPTHEWVQQFSGYVYPAFKGFWLPRSLLYGYFWHVTDDAYASNFAVNKKMEEVIADSIAADDEVTNWNLEWMDRFEKYAKQFMPKMFAANYYRNMVNYWIPFAYDANHRYPSIRFPWIVSVAYTSEVADETAQGEYLTLCAQSLVRHNLATIDMMLDSKHIYKIDKEVLEDNQIVSFVRQRPMIV